MTPLPSRWPAGTLAAAGNCSSEGTCAVVTPHTLTLGWNRLRPQAYSMYVHCRTNLVNTFDTLYPDVFQLIGNRQIRFNADQAIPTDELSHCIELAMTYHLTHRSPPRNPTDHHQG